MNINERLDTTVAFLSGDLLTTVILTIGNPFGLLHPIMHALSILILGAIGGFGGLAGKAIYMYLEKKWKKRFK